MITSQTGAPETYAELYESYFGMMKSIVRKMGIHAEDVEDVASEILCKFMEKDALTWFDPDYVSDAGEAPRTKGPRYRPARFSNLLRSFTSTYCLQWRDKQQTFDRREPTYAKLDAPVDDEGSWGELNQHRWYQPGMEKQVESRLMLVSATTSAQLRATQAAENAEASAQEQVWELRREAQQAARVAKRHQEGLQAVIRLAEAGTQVTGKSLARECGWSPSTGMLVLREVRQELRAVGL